ncbi:MAG TPA: hypothetical protein VFG11_02520 [Acidobacteriota bacterium]|nr:hypothetical protein [Acidobacteriota bacterium]
MRAIEFFAVLIVAIAQYQVLQAPPERRDSIAITCEMQHEFYRLWAASEFGRHPYAIERAAWIVNLPRNQRGLMNWPQSLESVREEWKGALPGNAIALVHTHPNFADPKPSRGDIKAARQIRLPIYTVSRSGIWMVTPDGRIVLLLGERWYEFAANSCG